MSMKIGVNAIAVVLLVVATATPAFANCGSDSYIERRLKSFGFDVDPATLSNIQMAQICAALASAESPRETMYQLSAALKAK